jgi:hypothetical protein
MEPSCWGGTTQLFEPGRGVQECEAVARLHPGRVVAECRQRSGAAVGLHVVVRGVAEREEATAVGQRHRRGDVADTEVRVAVVGDRAVVGGGGREVRQALLRVGGRGCGGEHERGRAEPRDRDDKGENAA